MSYRDQPNRRRVSLERLESRLLLASSWQNLVNQTDVDNSGETTPLDALLVVNRIASQDEAAPMPERSDGEFFYDVSGDQEISARDTLIIINRLAMLSALNIEELALPDDSASPNETVEFDFASALSGVLGQPIGENATYETVEPSPNAFMIDPSSGMITWTVETELADTQVPVRIKVTRPDQSDLEVSWSYFVTSLNLVQNGSFENFDASSGNSQDGQQITYAAGANGITDWEVTGNTVDLVISTWVDDDGNNSVDLAGTPGPGGVSQELDVEVGQLYRLTFALAGNPAFSPVTKQLTVKINDDSELFLFDTFGQRFDDMGWRDEVIEFTATSSKANIQFISDNLGGGGAVVDNVRLFRVLQS